MQTLILDSSQLSTYWECPEKWHISYLENITKENTVDEPVTAGTYGHKLLERYYEGIATGKSHSEAVAYALAHKLPLDYPLSADMKGRVVKRFNDYWMTYCTNDVTPALGKPTHSIVEQDGSFLDTYTPKALVEQGFSYHLFESREYLFILEGKIDMIYKREGVPEWMDHKFQFRERTLYNKSIQFRNYSLVTGFSIGCINYIGLQKEVTAKTFRRQIITFSPAELKEWRQEIIEKFVEIATALRRDWYFGPGGKSKNRDSCTGKFGYACPFTKICEESNPHLVKSIKEIEYVKKEIWRPW